MAQTISTNSPHLAPDTIRTPARPPLQGMLFFPPPSPSTADLAVDGLLLSGALMPRPSVLEQQQRNQQLQRQLFLMEQQLQQQPFPLGALLPPAAPLGETSPAGLALTIPSFPVDTSTPFSSSSSSGQPVPAPLGPLPNPQSQVSLLPALPPTGPCSACQQPIAEKSFLLVDGRCWHPECVRCAICGQNLEREGSSCFVRDGFLFCARDYFQKFGKRCERCGVGIERGEMVMRVPRCDSAELALFHLHCFSCVCCGHLLSPGQQYTVAPSSHPGGPLFCTAHFHLNPFTHLPPPGMGADSERQGQRFLAEMVPPQAPSKVLEQLVPPPHASSTAPQNNCVLPNASQQMLTLIEANSEISPDSYRQLRGPLSAGTPNGRQNGEEDGHEGRDESVCSNGADSQANGRQKRMRTSFKHHQLRTMKNYFGLNHNPDAKDLKQLAQKTGLTKRVLQVWFQNARAKYRRNQQHRGGMLDAHVQMQMIGQPVLNTNTNGGSGHSLSAAGFAPRSLMGDQMAVVGPTGSSAIVVPVPKAASISPMGSSLGGFESVNGSTADEQSSDNDAPQRGANYQ